MLANGSPADPFSMKIRFAPQGSEEVAKKVTQYAALNQK